jgi:hypothetical protein
MWVDEIEPMNVGTRKRPLHHRNPAQHCPLYLRRSSAPSAGMKPAPPSRAPPVAAVFVASRRARGCPNHPSGHPPKSAPWPLTSRVAPVARQASPVLAPACRSWTTPSLCSAVLVLEGLRALRARSGGGWGLTLPRTPRPVKSTEPRMHAPPAVGAHACQHHGPPLLPLPSSHHRGWSPRSTLSSALSLPLPLPRPFRVPLHLPSPPLPGPKRARSSCLLVPWASTSAQFWRWSERWARCGQVALCGRLRFASREHMRGLIWARGQVI